MGMALMDPPLTQPMEQAQVPRTPVSGVWLGYAQGILHPQASGPTFRIHADCMMLATREAHPGLGRVLEGCQVLGYKARFCARGSWEEKARIELSRVKLSKELSFFMPSHTEAASPTPIPRYRSSHFTESKTMGLRHKLTPTRVPRQMSSEARIGTQVTLGCDRCWAWDSPS